MNNHIQVHLENVTNDLVAAGKFPKHVDVAHFGQRYWVSCYDVDNKSLMDEASSAGFASDPQTALFKALSERVERESFRSGYKKGITACMTERSDGFAAFPKYIELASHKVRESALSEAIERFVWATWWDNHDIAFSINTINRLTESEVVVSYANQIIQDCYIGEIFIIQPQVKDLGDKNVTIIFGHLKEGGFISGGACGEDLDQTLLRSLDELLRHGLALNKLKTSNSKVQSFYEQRLAFFGLGNGNNLVSQRLSAIGTKSIELPNLQIDEAIDTEYEKHFLVHRCLFQNQPEFIGGRLERMCL